MKRHDYDRPGCIKSGTITTADLDGSLADYRDLLGLDPVGEHRQRLRHQLLRE